MLYKDFYYWGTIRKTIVSFASLFADIRIHKFDANGNIEKDIRVPLSYSGKEKYTRIIDSDKAQTQVQVMQSNLPKMSFELNSIEHDPSRNVAWSERFFNKDEMNWQLVPVPYILNLSLHLYTKTSEDMFQIIEQILPFFNPNYTITLNIIPELEVVQDVPFTIRAINPEVIYSEDFDEYRYLIYSINFTAKIELFGAKETTNTIKIVDVDLGEFGSYKLEVNPSSANKNDTYTLVETIKESNI